jgi:hypothetical protein
MLRLFGLIVMRTVFVGLLLFVALFACAFLLGYPGPFIIVAFSLGGLPAWVIVRRRRWVVAVFVAIVACIVPVLLLIAYTGDGDFTIPGLLVQLPFLGLFAYAFAYAGIEAGRFVWLPPERRCANEEPNPRPLP